MVKNIKSWELKRSYSRAEQIFVNSFPDASDHEMRTYCKPYFIFHISIFKVGIYNSNLILI